MLIGGRQPLPACGADRQAGGCCSSWGSCGQNLRLLLGESEPEHPRGLRQHRGDQEAGKSGPGPVRDLELEQALAWERPWQQMPSAQDLPPPDRRPLLPTVAAVGLTKLILVPLGAICGRYLARKFSPEKTALLGGFILSFIGIMTII